MNTKIACLAMSAMIVFLLLRVDHHGKQLDKFELMMRSMDGDILQLRSDYNDTTDATIGALKAMSKLDDVISKSIEVMSGSIGSLTESSEISRRLIEDIVGRNDPGIIHLPGDLNIHEFILPKGNFMTNDLSFIVTNASHGTNVTFTFTNTSPRTFQLITNYWKNLLTPGKRSSNLEQP